MGARRGRESGVGVFVLAVSIVFVPQAEELIRLPRFIFNFPALRLAKTEYWTEQIQPFFDSFAERDLSTTKERSEVTKRFVPLSRSSKISLTRTRSRLLAMGLTRILGTYYGTCIRPIGPSSPARPSIAVMRRIDHLFPGSMESLWRTLVPGTEVGYNAWAAIVETEAGRKGNDVRTLCQATM